MLSNELKCGLWIELERNKSVLEASRARHPVLTHHATVASILGSLTDEGHLAYETKEDLVRVAVAEVDAGSEAEAGPPSGSFWSALLLLTFYPMLRRLRGEVVFGSVGRDDLDHLVILAFLETVGSLGPVLRRKNLVVRIKSRTRKRLFKMLRAEELANREPLDRLQELGVYGDPLAAARPGRKYRNLHTTLLDDEQAEATTALIEKVGTAVSPQRLGLVLATQVRRESLRVLADRLYPDAPPTERHRIYQRLKRQHSRARARVQEALLSHRPGVPVCPSSGSVSDERSSAYQA